jgi:transposase-like protein
MGRAVKFSPEVKARAVRLVRTQQDAHDSKWTARFSPGRSSTADRGDGGVH